MEIGVYHDHYWELSNEVLYANLPQRASKLPEVKDLDFWIYLITMDFLVILTLNSGSFDAPWWKTLYSTSFESSH